ncbi:MAG: hypothetical protein U9R19_12050, partial [Bacteroidota bacterium]|nr:hypothetical protein [Bacteroidota bacterium]
MNSIFKTISGIVFLALLLLFAEKLAGQIDEQLTERDTQKYAWRLSKSDSLKLANLPELRLPHHAMMHKNTLPDVWDNTVEIYFRPMFNDVAYECGQGSGIALGFNYELNFMRGTDASQTQNQIPTHFVYNFHNAGETYVGVSYFDSWEILKEMGSPSVQDYGGMHIGSSGLREKIWPDGYDVYYAGMHNRSDFLYSIKVNTPDGLETLKLWLYNHAGNSSIGGIANFYSKFMHSGQLNFLPAGTPEAGKYVVTSWGYSNHGMTIVGWNDSIRYDYNNDGQYTDSIDINNDGIIDMQDWENGGLIFANTYANPGGYSYANSGFCYMMYATLAMHYTNGGIWNNEVHVFTAKENCEPLLTWKIKLRHTCRNKLRIHVGVAADTAASIPDEIITFKTFNGEGGDFYLQGGTDTLDQYLEFGLDISELLNYVDSGQNTRYFFIVDEIDPNNEGEGDLVKLWLIDYTNGIDVSPCSYNNVPLNDDSTSTFSIVRNISFSPVKINTTSLPPAIVHAAYSEPISASGGDNPYYWELMYDYTETITTDTFPEITSVLLDMNSGQNGSCGQALDFDFPFYGEMIDSITISIDGFIMFEYDDYYWKYAKSSILMIKLHKILSPFLANMAISSSSGGVWYEGDSTQATFRWKSYLISQSGTDINFAIRLFPSGKIEIFYGD